MNSTHSEPGKAKPDNIQESDTSWYLFQLALGAAGAYFSWAVVQEHTPTLETPGPGMMPLVLSIVIGLSGLIGLGSELIRGTLTLPRIPWRWTNAHTMIAATLVFVVALEYVGFLISAFLYSTLMMRYLGTRWRTSVLLTLVLVGGIQLLFVQFFHVQLPTGFAGF